MLPTTQRWLLYGFAFGLCFPLGALSFDFVVSDLSFSWEGIKQAHSHNLLHWIIDSAPIVLGFMGWIIGVNRHHLEIHSENLEKLVDERTLQLQRNQLELSEFLNSAPVMMWMTDAKGKPLTFNDAWLGFTNRTLEQEISHKWIGEAIHSSDREDCISLYNKSISKKLPFEHEFRCRGGLNNHYRWLMESGIPRFSNKGEYQGHTGVCIDISDRIEVETKLFEEKERAQVTLQSIADGVITTDPQGAIHYMNPVAEQMTGWTLDDSIEQPLNTVFTCIHHKTLKKIQNPTDESLATRRVMDLDDLAVLVSRSGQEFSITGTVAPILGCKGEILGVVLGFTDVTESRLVAQKMTHQATHDSLTNLFNRREFEHQLRNALEKANEEQQKHALCYMDLDQFKIVNDTCGHLAGDELLCQVTALIQKRIREEDILARLGGDEFGIILRNCSLSNAEQTMELIRKDVDEYRFIRQGKTFRIGVSIGLVAITESSDNITDLLIKADASCYQAKEQGRNRVHVYHEEDIDLSQKHGQMGWVSKIHAALEENRLLLYAQPIVSIKNKEKIHYEILTRMYSDDGSCISFNLI